METISSRGQFTTVIRLENAEVFPVTIKGVDREVYEVRASIRENGMASIRLSLRGVETQPGGSRWAVNLTDLPAAVQAQIQHAWDEYRASLATEVTEQENRGRLAGE